MMDIELDRQFFEELLTQARLSPRKRSHKNLHSSYDEPVQRLFSGLTKGTYVRPHNHARTEQWELLLVLQGEVCLVTFEADGKIKQRINFVTGQTQGVQLAPSSWHAIFPVSNEAVILEVKQGPFVPKQEEDFAPWSPAEGSETEAQFLDWLEVANIGEYYGKSL